MMVSSRKMWPWKKVLAAKILKIRRGGSVGAKFCINLGLPAPIILEPKICTLSPSVLGGIRGRLNHISTANGDMVLAIVKKDKCCPLPSKVILLVTFVYCAKKNL